MNGIVRMPVSMLTTAFGVGRICIAQQLLDSLKRRIADHDIFGLIEPGSVDHGESLVTVSLDDLASRFLDVRHRQREALDAIVLQHVDLGQ